MKNIRIATDNALVRAVTLTASSTAGILVADNVLKPDTSNVHRALGTSVTYTATWATAELIGGVFLRCNLSPGTLIRARAYAANGTTLLVDTGMVLACPWPALRPLGFTPAQAASAYAYGGGTNARVWFDHVSAFKLVIDIVDATNEQGYAEVACMVAARYWSPAYNAAATGLTFVDSTQITETEAGDTWVEAGTIKRQLPIPLTILPPDDRTTFVNLLRNSRAYPVLVSLYPESEDLSLERDYIIYGYRVEDSEVTRQFSRTYGSTVKVREF